MYRPENTNRRDVEHATRTGEGCKCCICAWTAYFLENKVEDLGDVKATVHVEYEDTRQDDRPRIEILKLESSDAVTVKDDQLSAKRCRLE